MATAVTQFVARRKGETRSAGVVCRGKRRISLESSRALEMLAHAIAYLTDSCACVSSDGDGKTHLDAVLILMERNREVYFSCPVIPTFGERCEKLFGSCFQWLHANAELAAVREFSAQMERW